MPSGCRTDCSGVDFEEVGDEVVGMLALDPVLCEHVGGEILEVERDDDVGACANRGCKDMTIVRVVRKRESRNQALVARHEAVPHVSIHEVAGTLKLLPPKIRARFEDISYPFLMNVVGPPRTKEVGDCQVHQEVAQWRGIENASIVERRQKAQGS